MFLKFLELCYFLYFLAMLISKNNSVFIIAKACFEKGML